MQRPLSVPCLLRRPAPQLRLSFSWRCPFFVVLRLPKQRKDFRDGHHVLELSILCMVWVGDRLGPQHSVGAVFILGYHVGKWNFLAGGRHAPNHPADPLSGTSRHHCLVGGLDEQPTLKLIPYGWLERNLRPPRGQAQSSCQPPSAFSERSRNGRTNARYRQHFSAVIER